LYLSGRYHRLIVHKAKTTTAMAVGRMILELCWHVLNSGLLFVPQRSRSVPCPSTEEDRLIRRLEKLGHRVTAARAMPVVADLDVASANHQSPLPMLLK
jgi:hypothetical protein